MEKQNDRDGLATQKLGEDYVDLTVCENRCLMTAIPIVLRTLLKIGHGVGLGYEVQGSKVQGF